MTCCVFSSAASGVDYSDHVVQYQLVWDLYDQEILSDLLCDERVDRMTVEIVEFIAKKERVSNESTSSVGHSQQKRVCN